MLSNLIIQRVLIRNKMKKIKIIGYSILYTIRSGFIPGFLSDSQLSGVSK